MRVTRQRHAGDHCVCLADPAGHGLSHNRNCTSEREAGINWKNKQRAAVDRTGKNKCVNKPTRFDGGNLLMDRHVAFAGIGKPIMPLPPGAPDDSASARYRYEYGPSEPGIRVPHSPVDTY